MKARSTSKGSGAWIALGAVCLGSVLAVVRPPSLAVHKAAPPDQILFEPGQDGALEPRLVVPPGVPGVPQEHSTPSPPE